MFFVSYMILSLFILCIGIYSSDASDNKPKINVGTVLFTHGDIARACWDDEGVALLSSRYEFENVLPDQSLIIITDNSVVNDIVDYFRLLLSVVRNSTNGRSRRLLILALSDTIGGYLHRFVLPIARYAFYNGFIQFESVEKLYILFGSIKDILRTNGKGWAGAHYIDYPSFSPQPLAIMNNKEANSTENACNRFTSTPTPNPTGGVTIPLPFTDSRKNPVSIALPFKGRSMVALTSKHSKNVLVSYYVTSMKCLKSLNSTDSDVTDFNSRLMFWLGDHVLPHLYSDQFYPAFGGVLQIVETMKNNGVDQKEIDSYKPTAQDQPENDFDKQDIPTEKKNLLLTALLATILIWLILGCIFICCRIKSGKCQNKTCKGGKASCSCKSQTSQPTRSSLTNNSSTTTTKKPRRSYGSSSSLESRKKSDTHKRRKKDKNKFICYMETKDGFPTAQKAKSKKSTQSSPSLENTSKASPNTMSETKIRSLQADKSFSLETFGLTSSSEKMSREEGDYHTETTSTTSETVEEEEEEEEKVERVALAK